MLRLYLSRERPYAFTFENDPAAARGQIATGQFDLLVADDDTGHGFGRDLAREARAVNPGVKTVLMTGSAPSWADPELVDAWLLKPFYVPALLVVIDGLLRARVAETVY